MSQEFPPFATVTSRVAIVLVLLNCCTRELIHSHSSRSSSNSCCRNTYLFITVNCVFVDLTKTVCCGCEGSGRCGWVSGAIITTSGSSEFRSGEGNQQYSNNNTMITGSRMIHATTASGGGAASLALAWYWLGTLQVST